MSLEYGLTSQLRGIQTRDTYICFQPEVWMTYHAYSVDMGSIIHKHRCLMAYTISKIVIALTEISIDVSIILRKSNNTQPDSECVVIRYTVQDGTRYKMVPMSHHQTCIMWLRKFNYILLIYLCVVMSMCIPQIGTAFTHKYWCVYHLDTKE